MSAILPRPRWRSILRDAVSCALVASLLGVLGLFAWLTRQPEAPFFDTLEDWPVLGPAVAELRRAYAPPATAQQSGPAGFSLPDSRVTAGATAQPATDPTTPTPQPEHVFVGGGAVLRSAPDPGARELGRTRTILAFEILARQGPWIEVAYLPGAAEETTAWIDLAAPREQRPILGEAPIPPAPLPGKTADERLLALARSLLREPKEGRLGPYSLFHDLSDETVLGRLDHLAAAIEAAYAGRYGRAPTGRPAETVVIFERLASYRELQEQEAKLVGLRSSAHTARGLVALAVEGASTSGLELTLLHELGHLLNRRAVGPALPPWLEEGLAEELSLLGQVGRPVAVAADPDAALAASLAYLQRFRHQTESSVVYEGPLAGLDVLLSALRAGGLPRLEEWLRLDWEEFVRGDAALNYALAGWFVHYLLEGESRSMASRFRDFLAAVAEGAPPEPGALERALSRSLAQLDLDLRVWLLWQGERSGLTPG